MTNKNHKMQNDEQQQIHREHIKIISDDAIAYINKNAKTHNISEKYKNTRLF